MSDIPAADTLGLAPEPPAGPIAPDSETVARALEAHEQLRDQLYNSEEPGNLYYRKPEAAAKMRAAFDAKFQATMVRHGAQLPTPEAPEQIAARTFNEQWSLEMPAAMVAELDERIVAAETLSKEQQEKQITEIKYNIGETRWAQLANTVAQPRMSREAFVAAEGELQYERLVAQAKIARPGLPASALSDKYTVETLANFGRYLSAKNRARG
jgi:hypothetical protein